MTLLEDHKCDSCGKLRSQDTNHWRRIFLQQSGQHIIITGWDEKYPLSMAAGPDFELCGLDCTTKKIQELLSK